MDTENALIRQLQHAGWLTDLAENLHSHTSCLPWEDRFAATCDLLMECAGLETYEHADCPRSIIAFPHCTRRKRPAFIAIHAGYRQHYPEAFARFHYRTFTIEFVEAGKYGVAGASTDADTGTAAEDTALLD